MKKLKSIKNQLIDNVLNEVIDNIFLIRYHL